MPNPLRFVPMAAGALSYALKLPTPTPTAAAATPAAAVAETPGDEPMSLNALTELRDRLANVAARLDAQYAAAQRFASEVDAERQYVRGVADDLETFIMANATELVNEAFTRLQTDESKVQDQQKTIDDLNKQVQDLQTRAVDQATLDKIDSLLHPPADATAGAADDTTPPTPPVAPPAAPNA
jgi:uncharacterized coiled-coil protein SlyX